MNQFLNQQEIKFPKNVIGKFAKKENVGKWQQQKYSWHNLGGFCLVHEVLRNTFNCIRVVHVAT